MMEVVELKPIQLFQDFLFLKINTWNQRKRKMCNVFWWSSILLVYMCLGGLTTLFNHLRFWLCRIILSIFNSLAAISTFMASTSITFCCISYLSMGSFANLLFRFFLSLPLEFFNQSGNSRFECCNWPIYPHNEIVEKKGKYFKICFKLALKKPIWCSSILNYQPIVGDREEVWLKLCFYNTSQYISKFYLRL